MLDKTRTYMVLNYNTNQVAVTTKGGESYIIPAGADNNPSGIPFDFNEIVYINSTTNAFKNGTLWFEKEYQEDIYEELRIRDWKELLTNKDIEDIILNPTVEKLEKVVSIENPVYFDRIYGVYIGLKNAGASISSRVGDVMSIRYQETVNNKRKTGIKLKGVNVEAESAEVESLKREAEDSKKQVADMAAQMEQMQKMMEQLLALQSTTNAKSPTAVAAEKKTPAAKKPTAKKTAAKQETTAKE